MQRLLISLFFLPLLLSIFQKKSEAQNLKDILKSETVQKAIQAVKEVTAIQFEDLQGTWQYTGAACQLKSDELLRQAGGIALAESITDKLEAAYQRAGIKSGNFSYTFNRDSTFSCQISKKQLKGSYSYDVPHQTLTLSYYHLFNTEVQLSRNNKGIAFLFDADRLLKLITLLSGYSKSSALSGINKIAEQYNGMLLGFDLKREDNP